MSSSSSPPPPPSSSSTDQSKESTNTNRTSNINKTKKKKKTQGVYVRPSGAIERGSGFFVPGLEGPRVRLVFGTVLIVLTAINHVLMTEQAGYNLNNVNVNDVMNNFSFQETLAVGYSLLILFQALIEYVKEQRSLQVETTATRRADSDNDNTTNGPVLKQEWSTSTTIVDDTLRSKIQWVATAYMSMTPTQEIMLLSLPSSSSRDLSSNKTQQSDDGTILYRLGPESKQTATTRSPETISEGVHAAINELSQSKGGRISLPLTHPAVQALVLLNTTTPTTPTSSTATTAEDSTTSKSSTPSASTLPPRTVILQRINDTQCWMVVSNQLLASYTSGDLKWLGQMANYVVTS
ncbi:hypothetical protein IV203_014543 [Nitzschia inconspicua]|uniref:Uncharacterized protein n=1 Tax=Nitzschia inconspicua TaxID=303405 RepID=A0A9K3PSP4_9STRA|nr:hypothetical protein IV203_014543 [Nitzschia inconspicua]